ncbi:MAG: (d)CMP kinase [Acidobacteria bacterium]|nr:MAG: (d)CMP kinase [Acidobacteriota bacterium]REK04225.1 MAG: (d)CMP kinase [Acidobacteriota bacterium]REK15486.1 MAG: (d)CMP kinase [Acidobacteriota bacterium]REK46477.1 MAG: (d)CMP kinase [Acidobacteriota bacterium]
MIIAIDGPSGAGKSTLGKRLAKELGLLYLDTGAMYRAVALYAVRQGTDTANKDEMTRAADEVEISLKGDPENLAVLLNGEDVSEAIRTPEVGQTASVISTHTGVRRALVERQRQLGDNAEDGAVLDGRDIGTVVFPNADHKFFLTAKPEARAKRRFEEDAAKGRAVSLERTIDEIAKRDQRDATREDSPLTIAEDAVVIDTSEMGIEEVFERMIAIVRSER